MPNAGGEKSEQEIIYKLHLTLAVFCDTQCSPLRHFTATTSQLWTFYFFFFPVCCPPSIWSNVLLGSDPLTGVCGTPRPPEPVVSGVTPPGNGRASNPSSTTLCRLLLRPMLSGEPGRERAELALNIPEPGSGGRGVCSVSATAVERRVDEAVHFSAISQQWLRRYVPSVP